MEKCNSQELQSTASLLQDFREKEKKESEEGGGEGRLGERRRRLQLRGN